MEKYYFLFIIIGLISPVIILILARKKSISYLVRVIVAIICCYFLNLLAVYLYDKYLINQYNMLPNEENMRLVISDTARRLAPFTMAIFVPIYVIVLSGILKILGKVKI